jgi:hypothetical protein
VPDGVFDAFGWCASRQLVWQRPDSWSKGEPMTADNPARTVFVLLMDLPFLPRELARLHVPGLGLDGEWALAPYGIDDATDELYAHRTPPEEALWLATDSLRGLYWGLHDWAHFHNHGPFVLRAWTELQCDVTALAWLWLNRDMVGVEPGEWEGLRAAAMTLSVARFGAEGIAFQPRELGAERVQALVARSHDGFGGLRT